MMQSFQPLSSPFWQCLCLSVMWVSWASRSCCSQGQWKATWPFSHKAPLLSQRNSLRLSGTELLFLTLVRLQVLGHSGMKSRAKSRTDCSYNCWCRSCICFQHLVMAASPMGSQTVSCRCLAMLCPGCSSTHLWLLHLTLTAFSF